MPEVVYVVRGKVAKAAFRPKGAPGYIAKGDTVWLGWTDESGGWFQWERRHVNRAKRFSTPERALTAAQHCTGPWYSTPDPKSIEVLGAEWYPPVPGRLELV